MSSVCPNLADDKSTIIVRWRVCFRCRSGVDQYHQHHRQPVCDCRVPTSTERPNCSTVTRLVRCNIFSGSQRPTEHALARSSPVVSHSTPQLFSASLVSRIRPSVPLMPTADLRRSPLSLFLLLFVRVQYSWIRVVSIHVEEECCSRCARCRYYGDWCEARRLSTPCHLLTACLNCFVTLVRHQLLSLINETLLTIRYFSTPALHLLGSFSWPIIVRDISSNTVEWPRMAILR